MIGRWPSPSPSSTALRRTASAISVRRPSRSASDGPDAHGGTAHAVGVRRRPDRRRHQARRRAHVPNWSEATAAGGRAVASASPMLHRALGADVEADRSPSPAADRRRPCRVIGDRWRGERPARPALRRHRRSQADADACAAKQADAPTDAVDAARRRPTSGRAPRLDRRPSAAAGSERRRCGRCAVGRHRVGHAGRAPCAATTPVAPSHARPTCSDRRPMAAARLDVEADVTFLPPTQHGDARHRRRRVARDTRLRMVRAGDRSTTDERLSPVRPSRLGPAEAPHSSAIARC